MRQREWARVRVKHTCTRGCLTYIKNNLILGFLGSETSLVLHRCPYSCEQMRYFGIQALRCSGKRIVGMVELTISYSLELGAERLDFVESCSVERIHDKRI